VTAQATSAPVLIAVQALHGLTFGAFYVAAVQRVKELTPEHLSATGQAVFAACVFGLGGVLGYLIAGRAFVTGGSTLAFGLAAVQELVALLVVGVTWWLDRRR
jgi:PPP family 3-phenylpropionic acid transporter